MKIITYVAMLLAVIIAALAVTCTIKKAKAKYDERQKLIRGKGYRISFFCIRLNLHSLCSWITWMILCR